MDLYTLIDALFPPSADELVLRRECDEDFIARYRYGIVDGVSSLLTFNDAPVKAALHLAKFRAHRRATTLLGAVLGTHLARVNVQYVIVPVPLSSSRARERGYNQVERILNAADVHKVGRHEFRTDLLVRAKHTVPQTSLAREARLTNVAGAFDVRISEKARNTVTGRHLLIVDDVTTTGATLKAAKNAFLPLSPSSITLLALAH